MRYELVPLKSLDQAIADLPKGAAVSVTCSPAKGIATTQQLCEQLLEKGHNVVPHFAARLVEGPEHAVKLAAWVREKGIKEVFIIGGDAEVPPHYQYALPFMKDFLEAKPGVDTIGFGAYPDGHATISKSDLHNSVIEKEALLKSHGVKGLASTQMCFDAPLILSWLKDLRAAGFTTPINLGIPGVVDRTRLMSVGVRTGVGQSLRYLKKNKASLTLMFAPGGYDPTKLLNDIAVKADELNVSGIHSFTFNSTADTAQWANAILEQQV
jgi:methylenetetrahydrofolate reductase (NADPH)